MSDHPQITLERMMHLRHLKQAEQHIAQGERHIAKQEDLVLKLFRRGYNTATARNLLDNFYALQAEHIRHRDRILKQLVHSAPIWRIELV